MISNKAPVMWMLQVPKYTRESLYHLWRTLDSERCPWNTHKVI